MAHCEPDGEFFLFLFLSFLLDPLFHIAFFFNRTHSFFIYFTLLTVLSFRLHQLIDIQRTMHQLSISKPSYSLRYIQPTQVKLVPTLDMPLVGALVGLSCPECPSGSRNSLRYHKASQVHNITWKVSCFF